MNAMLHEHPITLLKIVSKLLEIVVYELSSFLVKDGVSKEES